MIDISKEKLICLSEAAKHLPARRNNKPTHSTTLYRWAKNGIGGTKLEALKVGSTLCTSLPALQRFFVKLTELEFETKEAKSKSKAPANTVLEAELDKNGI